MYQLLTVNEAAKILGLKPQTIRKMITKGKLPFYRIGRAIRISNEELQAIIKKGYHPQQNEILKLS